MRTYYLQLFNIKCSTVVLVGRVEDWMKNVMHEMHRTNRFITKQATYQYGKERAILRPEWIRTYLGMVTLAAGQIWWTAEVEEVFRKIKDGKRRAMIDYLAQQNQQIDDLVVEGWLADTHICSVSYQHSSGYFSSANKLDE